MENWQMFTIIGANLAILLAFMGTSIGLALWNDNKIEKVERDMKEFREMWAKETKEFHGRLISLEVKKETHNA